VPHHVDLSSAVAGGVGATTQIAELPLNGRSFMQLATLQPGVAVSRGTGRDFTGGTAVRSSRSAERGGDDRLPARRHQHRRRVRQGRRTAACCSVTREGSPCRRTVLRPLVGHVGDVGASSSSRSFRPRSADRELRTA